MRIDEELSKKIARLSFVCACLVVLLHSYQQDVTVGCVNVVEMFFSQGVTRIAVPFFFVVFGFLFFVNYENTWRGWCKKATARSKTLLLPYLTWSLIGLVNAVLWNQICTHPDTTFKWLNGHWWLKVLGFSTPPLMMYHFWFVRVLIIATVIAPLIYVGVRYLRWMLPLGCLVLRLIPAGGWIPYGEELMYISFGAWLATANLDGFKCWFRKRLLMISFVSAIVWIAFIVAHMAILHGVFVLGGGIIRNGMNIAGLIFLWTAYEQFSGNVHWHLVDSMAKSSFFVYAIHPFVMFYLRSPIVKLGLLDQSGLMYYIYSFVATTIVSVGLYVVMNKATPKWVRLGLTGGR